MRHLLPALFCLVALTSYSQSVEKVINIPTTSSSTPTRPTLLYTPDDYASATSTKYPLLVFLHGSGESGTNPAQIYNSTTAGGPAYLIEHGGWPSSFTNPVDKKAYKFIVISPQSNNNWSTNGDELDYIIKYMMANYRVDANRIYLTGLSAGGGGNIEYTAHLNGEEDAPTSANNHVRTWKAAAMVPMSAATNIPQQAWANMIAGDNVKVWGHGDPNNDTYGEHTQDLVDYVNKAKSGLGIFTPNTYGHGGWNNIYNPSYRQTINGSSVNIYEWMLSNTQSGTVVANPLTVSAGSNQVLSLPISTIILNGSASAATGHSIASVLWSKVSGPAGVVISTPLTMSTIIIGLGTGTFVFRFTITQENGQTASSDVSVTVGGTGTVALPTLTIGGNQTITLPASSVTLTSAASAASGKTIKGVVWSYVSGPNTPTINSPNSSSTSVAGLVQGAYVFKMTATQSDNQTTNKTVTITVNAAASTGGTYASPTATVSGNQSVSSSSANVTSSYKLTGASLSSVTWSKFQVPGQAKKKIGILGSSTAQGSGATTDASSFVGMLNTYYTNAGVISGVVNYAQSGYNPYQAMPTGYKPSTSVNAKLSPADVPDPAHNVTALLAQKPDVVLVCFPTNGFDVLTIQEVMLPLQAIYDACKAANVECYVTTSQPRTDDEFPAAKQPFLQVIRDSVMKRFGAHAINIYDALTVPGTTSQIPAYGYGDGIHQNDAGHLAIYNCVLGTNILKNLISSPAVIGSPSAQNTSISGLPNGVNKFQVTVKDSHGQMASGVTAITVNGSTSTTPPVAVAGPGQSITLPTNSVTLNGTSSTGTISSYAWTKVSGPNTPSIASPTSSTTSVTGLVQGTYVFQLSLNSGASASSVTITVNATSSKPPTVQAKTGAGQAVTLPTNSVTLNGTGSTGTITSYAWTKASGPNTPTIASPNSATTTVSGLIQGSYVFQLSVNGGASKASTTITVKAGSTTTNPVANAGGNQTVTLPSSTVILSGGSSSGTITSYAWTKVSGPNTPTISTPSAINTSVSGLVNGTYVFQLSVNNGASTSRVTITVNTAVVTGPSGPCKGTKYIIAPDPVDSSVYITHTNSSYKPGDTLVLNKDYSAVDIEGLQGTSSCPIVIMNQSKQVLITQRLNLDGCQYVKVTGSGTSTQYGIFIQQDPVLRRQWYHGMTINHKSKNIEVERVSMRNVDIGIVCETNEECDNSMNYPNWVLDSMSFHDNKIVGTWNEGMYIGNTSPDNASYDLRPVTCNGVTSYPAPMKNGYTKIYNNIVDSTGRGGIQLANAAYGVSEVYGNTVKHNGLNGDDAQGTAISVGLYTRAYIHDNTISNTFTWGIASIGGGATNVPLRIENNTIDSSGYLITYNLATTSRDVYNPRTEPTYTNLLTWAPQAIEIDTRTRLYTTDSPHPGTAVKGQDSTQFWIKDNKIGKKKATVAINVDDDYLGIQKVGNIICGNVNLGTTTAATVQVGSGIKYSSTCTVTASAETNIVTASLSSLTDSAATLNANARGNAFALYPNPVRDQFTLEINNSYTGTMVVQVIDPTGATKRSYNFNKDQSLIQKSISISDLTTGIYFIHVQIGNWTETKKVMKL